MVAALITVVSCLTVTAIDANGQNIDNTKALAISDYKTLRLVVEDIDSNQAQLSRAAVMNRAELRIRAAGLKPISTEHLSDDEPTPFRFLTIKVNLVNANFDGVACSISLGFKREATWPVAPGKVGSGLATVWDKHILGFLSPSVNASGSILGQLDELLDEFLNAYLKANQDGK